MTLISIAPHEMARSGAVRRATPDDAAALSRTLASAFHDDPVFAWCVPDAGARAEHLPAMFRIIVDSLLAHEDTFCMADLAGAALWVPPDQESLTESQAAELGAVLAATGPETLERFGSLVELMAVNHPDQPHRYLWFLGVHGSFQGQGRGSALLRSGLAWCDEQAVPAYLEATSEQNRALYERHGFEVTNELSVAGSPPLWSMWRPSS